MARMNSGCKQARELLLCHHLGLVIAMARRFSNRGLDLLDLISEGNLGLLVALEKFDASLGLRLSTYAVWWIRYYLQTAVATQVPIVRPPLRAQRRASREEWLDWCRTHGTEGPGSEGPRTPNDGALVVALSLHDDDVEAHFAAGEICHPDAAEEATERLDGRRLATLLRELVARLPQRQREVIIARFGLDGQEERTWQQLGSERGVTRERMRQVQAAALEALRVMLAEAGVTRDAVFA